MVTLSRRILRQRATIRTATVTATNYLLFCSNHVIGRRLTCPKIYVFSIYMHLPFDRSFHQNQLSNLLSFKKGSCCAVCLQCKGVCINVSWGWHRQFVVGQAAGARLQTRWRAVAVWQGGLYNIYTNNTILEFDSSTKHLQ